MDIVIHNDKSRSTIEVCKHSEDEQGNIFTVRKKFSVRWEDKSISIPAGFESDGASVPRIFWGLVFPSEDLTALRAAIVHDYIYRNAPAGWTRKEADMAFRDIMIRDGVDKTRAYVVYCSVRMFGEKYWRGKA